MALREMLLVGGFCVVGSVTQSLSGFGFGILLVAALPPLGLPLRDVVLLIGLLVIPNLAIGLWRLRRQVSLRRVAWLMVGTPLGVPLGIYLLTKGPAWLVHGLLGVVLIFAAVEPMLLARLEPPPEKPWWAVLTGAIAGALGATFGTGGPPLVIYFYRRQWPKEVTKACLMLMFSWNVATRTVGYVADGLITGDLLLKAAAISPAVILGTLVGERLFHSISQEAFRRVVAALLFGCGVYQLGRAVGLA
jgi:uncharacterized membrane protein YfcA